MNRRISCAPFQYTCMPRAVKFQSARCAVPMQRPAVCSQTRATGKIPKDHPGRICTCSRKNGRVEKMSHVPRSTCGSSHNARARVEYRPPSRRPTKSDASRRELEEARRIPVCERGIRVYGPDLGFIADGSLIERRLRDGVSGRGVKRAADGAAIGSIRRMSDVHADETLRGPV